MLTNYVLGFAFDPDYRVVLTLMPDDCPFHDLRGKWNGVGGKILSGEKVEVGMAREFAEEAGLYVGPDRWEKIALAFGLDNTRIHVLRTYLHPVERATGGTQRVAHVSLPTTDHLLAPDISHLVYLARHARLREPAALYWNDGLAHPHAEKLT